jgi:hypothetical protein
MSLATPHGESLPKRAIKALREKMTVTDDVDIVRGATDCYLVYSESGNSYFVDARDEVCQCPDHEFRGARCKHIRRVAYATGREPLPGYINADAVDPLLGRAVSRRPVAWTAEGVRPWEGP